MTELEAYTFAHNQGYGGYNVSQLSWEHNYDNGHKGEQTLCMWVKPHALVTFAKMLGQTAFDDGGICECSLCPDGDICISNFDEVLAHYDINPENIEPKNEMLKKNSIGIIEKYVPLYTEHKEKMKKNW